MCTGPVSRGDHIQRLCIYRERKRETYCGVVCLILLWMIGLIRLFLIGIVIILRPFSFFDHMTTSGVIGDLHTEFSFLISIITIFFFFHYVVGMCNNMNIKCICNKLYEILNADDCFKDVLVLLNCMLSAHWICLLDSIITIFFLLSLCCRDV